MRTGVRSSLHNAELAKVSSIGTQINYGAHRARKVPVEQKSTAESNRTQLIVVEPVTATLDPVFPLPQVSTV